MDNFVDETRAALRLRGLASDFLQIGEIFTDPMKAIQFSKLANASGFCGELRISIFTILSRAPRGVYKRRHEGLKSPANHDSGVAIEVAQGRRGAPKKSLETACFGGKKRNSAGRTQGVVPCVNASEIRCRKGSGPEQGRSRRSW